jgi:hypothetical protein
LPTIWLLEIGKLAKKAKGSLEASGETLYREDKHV